MTKLTLADYDLQRGDWVLFSNLSLWREFKSMAHELYCFYDGDYNASGGAFVGAVLRPNIIIRDNIGIPAFNLYPQTITFKKIHPKEKEKSLFEKVALAQKTYNEPRVLNALQLICDRIEALEKGKK